jgi:uncharacterized protein YqeY
VSLKQNITDDIKTSMKARDKQKTSVLRMILSEMKYAAAATNAQDELSDEAAMKVIKSYHKRLTKSLPDFPDGDKKDAIKEEIHIVDQYMPKMASEEQVDAVIDELLQNSEDRQFGVLMKQVMAKLGDCADGKVISARLKQKLST